MLTQQDKKIVKNFLQNLARQSQEDAILDFIDGKIIKTKLETADKLDKILKSRKDLVYFDLIALVKELRSAK